MKRYRQATLILFLSTTLIYTGCSLRESFQPLPPMFQNWAKPGVPPEGIKAALIACGYDNPYSGFDGGYSRRLSRKITINDLAANHQCMRRNGFRYLLGDGKGFCDSKEWVDLPACKSEP